MPGRNRMSPQDESTATQGGDTHGLLPILARRTMGGAGSSARVRQRYAEGRSFSRELVDCMFYKSVNYCRHTRVVSTNELVMVLESSDLSVS